MLTNQASAPTFQPPAASMLVHDTPVISIHALHKRYRDAEAVRGIDLEIRRGEIFAFLGPNGAGKTTTVEILEGFRQATSGTVEVLGRNPWRAPASWRERIGIVLQESEPEPGLSVRECLALYAGYYRAPARSTIRSRSSTSPRRPTSAPPRCRVDSGAGSTSRLR